MNGVWCLNPKERLSPGQTVELDRVTSQYTKWIDDEYVKEFIMADNGITR